MMRAQLLAHILSSLKKSLSQLARRSASLFFLFLSLLRRFTTQPRSSTGTLPRSQGDIAGEDGPVCSSLVPQISLEVAGVSPSSSDNPYPGTHSRPVRKNTAMPLHSRSMSSLHLSRQTSTGESSANNRLRESSSLGISPLSGFHELSRSHSRTSSINSRASGCSLTRSIAGSEIRQAAYRIHEGPAHFRPISVSSVTDLPSEIVPIPLDSLARAVPVPDPAMNHHTHLTVPPGGDGQPGSEVLTLHDAPLIAEMVADGVRRYDRCTPRNPDDCTTTVPAMTVAFPVHDLDVPPGWITVVHPEGSRYFVNVEKRTCTEMDICNKEICGDIEDYMEYFLRELKLAILAHDGLELDMKQIDLVLEPKKDSEDCVVFHYYFVNHRDRTLFWLDEFSPKGIISNCQGVKSLSHIQLAVQAQYWRHWDYFPSLCSVTQNLVNEVKDMLVHATCDHMTSRESSAAYDLAQLRDYISVVDSINVYPLADQSIQCYPAVVIGRIMHTFSLNRFMNFHGENCARLAFGQTIHDWVYTPSLLMVILAPLLFLDPVTHVKELHKIFADKIACTPRWDAYSLKLRGQLHDSNLMATVLLNANVGFLAINSVDRGGSSAIQMASYMSLVTSLGSIVLGLSLVSQDRTCGENTADEIASFLLRLHHENHGLEKLAIIYSLPKALLMWGMVFFCAAFSIDWWSSGDTPSRVVVGTVTLAVFAMILNGMIRTREGRHPLRMLGLLLRHLAAAWERGMKFIEIRRAQRVDSEQDVDPASMDGSQSEAEDTQYSTSIHFELVQPPEVPGTNDHETISTLSHNSVISSNHLRGFDDEGILGQSSDMGLERHGGV